MDIINYGISFSSFAAGIVVGLTGMGGGAIMMPLLVLGFGVPEIAAVSSDVIAAIIMKPVGAAVHVKHGVVRKDLAMWLILGSVPSALVSPYLLGLLKAQSDINISSLMRPLIGGTLLVAAFAMIAKALLKRANHHRASEVGIPVRPLATVLIGLFGGLVVGLTSVGAGSLMMVLLMWIYPKMSGRELVGTDLVQAVPLVAAAGVGHLFFGEIDWLLTLSIVLGAVPGIYLGARYSAKANEGLIRPLLAMVLSALGFKMIGANVWGMLGAAAFTASIFLTKFYIERRRRRLLES